MARRRMSKNAVCEKKGNSSKNTSVVIPDATSERVTDPRPLFADPPTAWSAAQDRDFLLSRCHSDDLSEKK